MKCIFCQFASGNRKKHLNGMPFKVLHQTKNTISFLSIDIPLKEDGQILIIPKKHYSNFEDTPKKTIHEIIDHVTLLIKTIRKTHDGCNILLNDGKVADQHVSHTHFHIIPRDTNDEILMRKYKSKKLNTHQFILLENKIKKELEKIL